MITNLHHVAILTSDMQEAVKYYVEFLGCPSPNVVQVDKPGMKLKSALLPIGPDGKTSLQIIEPCEGPGVKELAQRGEGALLEMAFEVDDAEEFSDRMATRGVRPHNIAEQPIEEKYITSKFGNKYYILPANKMRGTRIEIVEVVKPAKK